MATGIKMPGQCPYCFAVAKSELSLMGQLCFLSSRNHGRFPWDKKAIPMSDPAEAETFPCVSRTYACGDHAKSDWGLGEDPARLFDPSAICFANATSPFRRGKPPASHLLGNPLYTGGPLACPTAVSAAAGQPSNVGRLRLYFGLFLPKRQKGESLIFSA